MRKEEFFEIIGEADEEKIAAAGEVLAADKKPRIIWFKVAATVAACLCLVFAGIFFFRSEPNVELPAINDAEDSPSSALGEQSELEELSAAASEVVDVSIAIVEPMEGAHEASASSEIVEVRSEISATPSPPPAGTPSPPPPDSDKVITHYGDDSVEVEACYAIPAPGEYFCEIAVTEARKYYAGEDVRYLLGFNIFKENEEHLSHEEKALEYQRLIDLGYELYERATSSVVGMFTEEELEDFQVNPDYGYFFYFVSNRNSSAVDIDEDDLITQYHWSDGYVME